MVMNLDAPILIYMFYVGSERSVRLLLNGKIILQSVCQVILTAFCFTMELKVDTSAFWLFLASLMPILCKSKVHS